MVKHLNNIDNSDKRGDKPNKRGRRANRVADDWSAIDPLQSDPEFNIDEGDDEDIDDSEEDEFGDESGS